jgi:hypothetical protein
MYLSIDVGIKNLAFCLFCKNNKENVLENVIIEKWNVINLSQTNIGTCCIPNINKKSKSESSCLNQVKYYKSDKYFCLKHAKKQLEYKMPLKLSAIKKLKSKELNELATTYSLNSNSLNKNQIISLFEKYIETHCLEDVEQINASKLDLVTIGKNMMNSFDEILKDYILFIDTVIIENQISPIANRMKTVQGMISQYFIMRNQNIKIEFISSANKLKGFENTGTKLSYSDRKKMGIKYCLQLIAHDITWTNFFSTHKKKDDLADSYLQGIWYLNKISKE